MSIYKSLTLGALIKNGINADGITLGGVSGTNPRNASMLNLNNSKSIIPLKSSYRSLSSDGTHSIIMTLAGNSNNLIITTKSVPSMPSDTKSIYSASSAIIFGTDASFIIPNNGIKTWYAPFNIGFPCVESQPAGSGATCGCYPNCASGGCKTNYNGSEYHCMTASCNDCGDCIKPHFGTLIMGSHVILQANRLIYNGVIYF